MEASVGFIGSYAFAAPHSSGGNDFRRLDWMPVGRTGNFDPTHNEKSGEKKYGISSRILIQSRAQPGRGVPMQRVEASLSVSISALRRSPSSVMEAANGEPVAILNHNRVMAYMVSAEVYEAMLDRLDDLSLVETAKARASEKGEPVDIDDL